MDAVLTALSGVLWGPATLALFFGTGLYFTVRSGFLQCRWRMILRGTFGGIRRGQTDRGVSSLRTLTTALGACMGTGNIAGVGTALMTGGAGALFWMCVSAFFGAMTSFAETVTAMRWRTRDVGGRHIGGAMITLEQGLGFKKTAAVYALLLTVSSFGIGNMAQVNASASAIRTAFGVPPAATGAVFCALIALTICGGIRRISGVAEKTVPLLSVLFMVCAAIALIARRAQIPQALRAIWSQAWDFRAAAGGDARVDAVSKKVKRLGYVKTRLRGEEVDVDFHGAVTSHVADEVGDVGGEGPGAFIADGPDQVFKCEANRAVGVASVKHAELEVGEQRAADEVRSFADAAVSGILEEAEL